VSVVFDVARIPTGIFPSILPTSCNPPALLMQDAAPSAG
jgi:hypothetical protein